MSRETINSTARISFFIFICVCLAFFYFCIDALSDESHVKNNIKGSESEINTVCKIEKNARNVPSCNHVAHYLSVLEKKERILSFRFSPDFSYEDIFYYISVQPIFKLDKYESIRFIYRGKGCDHALFDIDDIFILTNIYGEGDFVERCVNESIEFYLSKK